jgi:predicted Zn-ribbon and HTH transcriptional regulator
LKFVNSVASVVCEKCCFAFGLLDVKLPSSCTASAHTGQCGKAW